MTRAGLPTATQKSGISPVTTEPAPMTVCFPIAAPGQHDGAVAEPRAVGDHDRARRGELQPGRSETSS